MPGPSLFHRKAVVSDLRLNLLGSDPGMVRLRTACRVLMTVVAVCSALFLLHYWYPMPAAAYAMAMITALQGAVAIKDTTAEARAVTRLYAALSAFTAIAAMSLVEHSLLYVNILLLIVIFLAVYARRFGTRWQGVGLFTFMCSVVGAFVKAPDTDLGDIAIALTLSGVIAHFVRNFVMPERPAHDFRIILDIAVSLSRKLHHTIEQKSTSKWTHVEVQQVLMLEHRARDAILLCESYLPLDAAASSHSELSTMAVQLFDLHLALESAVATALHFNGQNDAETSRNLGRTLETLADSLSSVEQAATRMPATFPAISATSASGKITFFPASGGWLKDSVFRQAVQVTFASAIAMAGGLALSPDRWFWAVMTAFLIFTNTQSRGDVAVKGLNRALGTGLGICVGIGLAVLVHGQIEWTLPLVAISIFAAFYLISISYSAMTFFITITLCLVYGLIGEFTPELLVLRLEETAIGAAAGIFVSLAVLPLGTSQQSSSAIEHFLKSLDQLMQAIIASQGQAERTAIMAAANALDKSRADILTAIGSMRSVWNLGMAQAGTRRILGRSYTLAHSARLLARHFRDSPPSDQDIIRLQAIRTALANLATNGQNMAGRSRVADIARLDQLPFDTQSDQAVANAFDLITHVLVQMQPANQEG
ncbi:hypothetical protein FPY71_16100 [Aureimonas fodinaquatilis]|uniref:Integral membrane bound transporter domain-containing protein n=1 Tax=Aureimonas fodinaquatilis TaxID=2565783 RepID=A0A5B0DSV3_9HYPH|nr:FUSC family protein [Aureimonas fodinaquatilis]KAA0969065.1 hypothetical protein FPY71_16100 [Aureimonas fodinaquatilis]